MVDRLLGVVVVYALVLSCLFGVFTLVDYHQLNHSVFVQDLDREMAHRINVFADGTWFLLSNLISILRSPRCGHLALSRLPHPSPGQSLGSLADPWKVLRRLRGLEFFGRSV